jgi:peptidoglycan/LPS O-acetylase OafA/YrhL/lysophospholipase L1-like esterase
MLVGEARTHSPEWEAPLPSRRASAAVAGRIEGLDGIRALAVLAVVIFHIWPRWVPGGFLGVDVFFVISGFLITTLLVREGKNAGRVDLPAFWRRRARRLLPALFLVVAVSVLLAAQVEKDLLVGMDRQALGALTFSSNWVELGAGANYFDSTAPKLFATFWSLAVEEQFYLLWPMVLVCLVVVARNARNCARMAVGLALVSAGLMAYWYHPGGNPTRVYYGTDTHLFGLMIGAAVAFAFAGDVGIVASRRWGRLRRWIGFVALAGLVAMMATVDGETAFPYRGGIALASLLTAVAVASLPGPSSSFVTLNRWRPLAWVGERSYGIYLWHWPVILILTELLPPVAPGADAPATTALLAVIVTLGLAEASYDLIEMPIRRDGFGRVLDVFREPRMALFGVGGLLVLVLAGQAIVTAPKKSEAQLAVEAGEQAIADAAADQPTPSTTVQPVVTQPTGAVQTTTTVPPAWPDSLPVPPGDQIMGFGDSVLSGAAPAIYERFPGIFLDAKPIRQWRDAPGVVSAALDAGTARPVVILNFGTNAGLKSEESRAALETVLQKLGPERRVVLVNTVGISNWVPETNATLAEISARYPNTIVADWHAVVTADPSLLHDDRTHPNVRGTAAYADLLARTLDQLGPR